jgi:hypothetical protein
MGTVRQALIVATDTFEDAKLSSLRAPAHDAEELARVLGDSDIGDFTVQVSLNEPDYVVRRKLSAFFSDRRTDDLLLLHVSSHGLKDEDGTLYFATTNTDVDHLEATAIPSEFVNHQMTRSRSRRMVLLLDCCFGGAFARGFVHRGSESVDVAEKFDGRGRVVLTASRAMEWAFEGEQLDGEARPSIFTASIVEGLETGKADRDQDNWVSVDELYDYVYDHVRDVTPNQTPSKWTFDVQGDLFLARSSYRAEIEPAELPVELRVAIESPLPRVRAGAVEELAEFLRGTHLGLALSARLALEQLLDDDSRRVAEAAARTLDLDVEAAVAQTASTEGALLIKDPSAEPAQVDPDRLSNPPAPEERNPERGGQGVAAVPEAVEPVESPVEELEPSIAGDVASAVVPSPAAKELDPPPAPIPVSAGPRARRLRLPLPSTLVGRVSTSLTIAGAVALVLGYFVTARGDESQWGVALVDLDPYYKHLSWFIWSPIEAIGVALLAVVVLVGGRHLGLARDAVGGFLVGIGLLSGAASFALLHYYDWVPAPALTLLGALAILAAGVLLLATNRSSEMRPSPGWASLAAGSGAALLIFALFLKMAVASLEPEPESLGVEPLSELGGAFWVELAGAGAVGLAAAALTGARRSRARMVVGGLLVAVGVQAGLHIVGLLFQLGKFRNNLSDEAWKFGGIVGLLGVALLLAAGIAVLRAGRDPETQLSDVDDVATAWPTAS